ncbi:High affinity cAMP-specific 3',5'-cyclic phosphodiesterase 7A [Chytriomyces hyalinus]|nr:High affinity cAMP-specific 3',5'-cyclic phosphodiesterase 7A [Chytriomyces hyalinus]
MSLSFAQISSSNGGVLSGKRSINSLPPSKLSNSAQFEEQPEKLKVQKEIPDAIIKSVAGNSLRGPTILQMIANYLFFLLLLGIAIQSNWAPFIRFYQLVLLVIISFVVIQISRIWQTKDQNTVLVFYLSLIPFTYLIVISREVHTITLLLWCSSILAIFLQSGIPNLSFHISVYSALGIFLYGGAVAFMKQFFRIKCPFPICGQPLKPPIDDRVEIILACAVIALVINCRFLDNYIKLNAIALLDRDNFLKQLYTANADLRRQIHQERQSDILDLESPLTKVLQILGEIRDSDAADAYMVKELDRLMKILNSDQLYTPDIFQKSADADVSEWLKSMMQAPKHEVASATASLESGFDSSLMIHGIPGTQGPTVTFSLIADSQVISSQESKIIEMLHDIDNPNFDVAVIESISNGRVLFYIGYHLFLKHNLLTKHKIPESVFRNWLTRIEHGYRGNNPYHNAIHAADVAHSMNYYITRPRVWNQLTPEEHFASLVAAIIHDFMHPGVNNTFLINTCDPLATRYNDLAVLENFHCSTVFELMSANPEMDILKGLAPEAQRTVRETIVSAVLATDIAAHFDWIGKFKNKVSGTSGSSGAAGINFDVKLDRRLVINMAIKCADVNNPSKPLAQCKYWTDKVMEEFFRQGDEELKRGVQVSMFMNRTTTDVPKCQIGFIDFIVLPLFEVWSAFMQEDVQTQMQNIAINKQFWKEQAAKTQNA